MLISDVNEKLWDLKLLVAAADCARALDVIDYLRNLLDTDKLAGLKCFCHMHDQLARSIQDINSILSAEFKRASMYNVKDGMPIILARIEARNFEMDEEEMFRLRDRLLPSIIGLLRTKKLPSELRNYYNTLTLSMNSTLRTNTKELCSPLVGQPMEPLAGFPSHDLEEFIQYTYGASKVSQVQLVWASEVKKAVEWIVLNLDSCDAAYATDSISVANAKACQELSPYSLQENASKSPTTSRKANDISSFDVSSNLRDEVLMENTKAVILACQRAHEKWEYVLRVRHAMVNKVSEDYWIFYKLTKDVLTATDTIGGKLTNSVWCQLRLLSADFISYQHDSMMAKIKAVLDRETWTSVDVPDESQAIIMLFRSSEVSTNDRQAEALGSPDISSKADGSPVALPSQLVGQNESNETFDGGTESNNNTKEQAQFTSQTLTYGAVGYHMVNSGLILLEMLSQYVEMANFWPEATVESTSHVGKLLEFFNTRTRQLVLGAGAMQVSGLTSIEDKHLALASQVISFVHAIIPEIEMFLFRKRGLNELFKPSAMCDFDRVAENYEKLRDDIHVKLVEVMKERFLVRLTKNIENWNWLEPRGFIQIVESSNRRDNNDSEPNRYVCAMPYRGSQVV